RICPAVTGAFHWYCSSGVVFAQRAKSERIASDDPWQTTRGTLSSHSLFATRNAWWIHRVTSTRSGPSPPVPPRYSRFERSRLKNPTCEHANESMLIAERSV